MLVAALGIRFGGGYSHASRSAGERTVYDRDFRARVWQWDQVRVRVWVWLERGYRLVLAAEAGGGGFLGAVDNDSGCDGRVSNATKEFSELFARFDGEYVVGKRDRVGVAAAVSSGNECKGCGGGWLSAGLAVTAVASCERGWSGLIGIAESGKRLSCGAGVWLRVRCCACSARAARYSRSIV